MTLVAIGTATIGTDQELHTNVQTPEGAEEDPTVCMVVDDSDSDLGEAILLQVDKREPVADLEHTDADHQGHGRGHAQVGAPGPQRDPLVE